LDGGDEMNIILLHISFCSSLFSLCCENYSRQATPE